MFLSGASYFQPALLDDGREDQTETDSKKIIDEMVSKEGEQEE